MPFGLNYKKEVTIGEHKITLPECPKDRKEILFIDKSPEDAYWQREDKWPEVWKAYLPNETILDQEDTKYNDETGLLVRASVKDSDIIRDTYFEIMMRRINGVFFRNKNDIEYLTGANWFTLEFCKMFGAKGSGYGSFFKYQRDVFYILDYVEREDWILGLYISKAKKTGITQIIDGGWCVERVTRKKEYLVGFMSRNMDAAIDNNFKLFLYAFNNLPPALKPTIGTVAERGGRIDFALASRGSKANKNSSVEVLNSRVFCGPSAEHTFDSHFMNVIRLDELPKLYADSRKSPKEVFNGNKAACKDQDVFRGVVIISSYPPEQDDIGSKEGEEIYEASKLSTLKHGRTESELICYHIAAYKSIKSFIDKYGDCDEVGAMQKIMQNRERLKKDRRALLAEMRQNPNDEEEAFGSGKAGAVFDPIRITEIKNNIKEEQRATPGNLYQSGRLEWTNWKWEVGLKNKRPKGQFCPVKFVPLTEAELEAGIEPKIRIYNDIPLSLQNQALRRGKDEYGCLIPPDRYRFVTGGDPTQYAAGTEVIEGSKNAALTFSVPDEKLDLQAGTIASNLIHIEYFHRPEMPEEAFEDYLKLIIFTDSMTFMEANAPYIATRLIEEGIGRFMVVRNKENGTLCLWERWMGFAHEEDKLYQLFRITNNGVNAKEHLETIVRLWKMYFGLADTVMDKDYGKTIKSERLMEQAGKFDTADTKKSDLMMAGGYGLWGIDLLFDLLMTRKKDERDPDMDIQNVLTAFRR